MGVGGVGVGVGVGVKLVSCTVFHSKKEAAFLEFAEKGFFQPSMSQLIEDAPTITELELKNVEPYPEQKFEDLFKRDHLPAHHKKTC